MNSTVEKPPGEICGGTCAEWKPSQSVGHIRGLFWEAVPLGFLPNARRIIQTDIVTPSTHKWRWSYRITIRSNRCTKKGKQGARGLLTDVLRKDSTLGELWPSHVLLMKTVEEHIMIEDMSSIFQEKNSEEEAQVWLRQGRVHGRQEHSGAVSLYRSR